MSADPVPLDALIEAHRAILSLLLVQGRSYHEIAELLRIDTDRVRERAHAAIEALAAADVPPPDAAARARVADYLLGEQPVSERARTRARLAGSEPDRVWAERITLALSPLTKDALPAIPELNPPAGPDAPPSDMNDPSPPPVAFTTEPPSDPRRRPYRAMFAGVGLLGLVAVAVVLVIVVSGGSSAKRNPGVPSGAVTRRPRPSSQPARTIKRLILTPTASDLNAFGAAAIVRPTRGGMVLLLRGQGLPASDTDSYAVWLFNAPDDSRLLGFISPNAGSAGTFSSGTQLPADAVRFRELIVTLETSSRPTIPGHALLKAPLGLSSVAGG